MRNLGLIIVFVVAAGMSTAIFPLVYWLPKALACRTNADPTAFLTYCNSDDYGDYEHGAFYWNLEPEATKALRSARILFLGNSRLQFGFSTEATRHYFQEKNMPYYLAGFTYFENMVFIGRLIDQYDLNPDVIVINADGTFFSEQLLSTPAAMFIAKQNSLYWRTLYGYLLKAAFTRIVRPICETFPFACSQKLQTLWRRRETGDWLWQGTFAELNRSIPIDPATRPPTPDEETMRGFEKAADSFLRTLRIRRQCIILTAVPNSVLTDEPIADRLGERFQLPVIVPHLDALATLDESHLNAESAERWSEAFLRAAAPMLDRCLRK
ncbi:hypothetical protein [Bradyrhizobium lupini]|uniref:hypothetical protein n=1 Tax=Rhizobium lupini TaxID=136996 RepID=UPI0034C6D11E